MLINKDLLELVCNSFYLLTQNNTYQLWQALDERDEELLNRSEYPFSIFNPDFAETVFWCDYDLTTIKDKHLYDEVIFQSHIKHLNQYFYFSVIIKKDLSYEDIFDTESFKIFLDNIRVVKEEEEVRTVYKVIS